MNTKYILLISICFYTISFFSCEKEDTKQNKSDTESGDFFITNEGSFGNANASLSIYRQSSDEVLNDVFYNVNNRPLGDVLQSMGMSNGKYYFLLNASNKIEVSDSELSEIKTIENINLPRYFADLGNKKAVISTWNDDGMIYLLNTETDKIIDSLKTANGAERMMVSGDYTLVANSGGFSSDSVITVVNNNSFDNFKNIQTKVNPVDFAKVENSIYVLCSGKPIYDASWQLIGHIPSYILKLDAELLEVQDEFILGDFHPNRMCLNKEKDHLFVGGGFGVSGIYKIAINDSISLPAEALIKEEFYGFNVNQESGNIYALSSPDFTSSGKLKIFDSDGKILNEHKVGIGPNNLFFE